MVSESEVIKEQYVRRLESLLDDVEVSQEFLDRKNHKAVRARLEHLRLNLNYLLTEANPEHYPAE
jgi:hypothetical protein